MQASVLLDDSTTVYAYDFPVWESLLNDAHGFLIEVGLVVGRHEHGIVDDQIVSIGCWKAIVSIIDGAGQGKL